MADGRIEADEPREHGLGAASGASLVLHAAVAAVLVAWTWATLREPAAELEPEVFRVVTAGASSSVATRASESVSERTLASEPELLFVAPPSVRSWSPPPQPSSSSRVEERGEARSSVSAEPVRDSARTISYAEYQRRQAASPVTERRPRVNASDTGAASSVSPRIDVGRIWSVAKDGTVASKNAADGATGSAMQEYFGDLVGRLRDSHKLPKGVDGLLKTEVQFTLAANGVVSDVRVLRSSGSEAFDQSVLKAFRRVMMPARPDGKTDVQRLTFRVTE